MGLTPLPPLWDSSLRARAGAQSMKVPLQQEILDILKQRLVQELEGIKADLVNIKAEIKVITGRLDRIDERFEQVDKHFEQVDKRFDKVDEELRDLKNDVREVRSYVFTSHLSERTYSAVREK
jgi:chromosome segregation ATPase